MRIIRYKPGVVALGKVPSANECQIGTVMSACSTGEYVSFRDHCKKVEALQSELDALKSMQNHQNSDDAIAAINDAVATCVKTELERFFKQAAEKTFKVDIDPARALAKEWSDALKKVDNAASGGVFSVTEDGFSIVARGSKIKLEKLSPDAHPPKQYYAKCIYARGKVPFTFGKEYQCHPHEDFVFLEIYSDDFVSDLDLTGTPWDAVKVRDGVYDVFGDNGDMAAMFELIQK